MSRQTGFLARPASARTSLIRQNRRPLLDVLAPSGLSVLTSFHSFVQGTFVDIVRPTNSVVPHYVDGHDRGINENCFARVGPTHRSSQQFDLRGFELRSDCVVEMMTHTLCESCKVIATTVCDCFIPNDSWRVLRRQVEYGYAELSMDR